MLPDCNTEEENQIVTRARALLATYEGMADMIRLGAYRRGSDPQIDEAIRYYPSLERFMSQGVKEKTSLEDGYSGLASILEMIGPGSEAQDLEPVTQEPSAEQQVS
tara:strand:- start:218 stop:535 length:318 start_codon:yes stop_codon:yes gene_type:complete